MSDKEFARRSLSSALTPLLHILNHAWYCGRVKVMRSNIWVTLSKNLTRLLPSFASPSALFLEFEMPRKTYQKYNPDHSPEPSCPLRFDLYEYTNDVEIWLEGFWKSVNSATASGQSAFVLVLSHYQSYFGNHLLRGRESAEGHSVCVWERVSDCL